MRVNIAWEGRNVAAAFFLFVQWPNLTGARLKDFVDADYGVHGDISTAHSLKFSFEFFFGWVN